mgnify:CR=1 FL=1
MLLCPREPLGRGEAAATRPAIAGGHAAAHAMLAGKWLGSVLGACRRQWQTNDGNDLADESQPRAAAASKMASEVFQPSPQHGADFKGVSERGVSQS